MLAAMQTSVRTAHEARQNLAAIEVALREAGRHLTAAVTTFDHASSKPASPTASVDTANTIAGMIRHGVHCVERARYGEVAAFNGSQEMIASSESGFISLIKNNCSCSQTTGCPYRSGLNSDVCIANMKQPTGSLPVVHRSLVAGMNVAVAPLQVDPEQDQGTTTRSRVFHLRTRIASSRASLMLSPKMDVADGADATGTVRIVAVPPNALQGAGPSAARSCDVSLPPPPLSRETVRELRRAVMPLGLRVTRRGMSLLIRSQQGGARGRFKLRMGHGAEAAWDIVKQQDGVDATVRVDGKPALVSGDRAIFRNDHTDFCFSVGGPLADPGGELNVRVTGGVPVPVERRVGADASWVPAGWPRGRTRAANGAGDVIHISLPRMNATTLGTRHASMASIMRVAGEGRLLPSTRDALLAALREIFSVNARVQQALSYLEAALITAAADFCGNAATKSEAGEPAACDGDASGRRLAA